MTRKEKKTAYQVINLLEFFKRETTNSILTDGADRLSRNLKRAWVRKRERSPSHEEGEA